MIRHKYIYLQLMDNWDKNDMYALFFVQWLQQCVTQISTIIDIAFLFACLLFLRQPARDLLHYNTDTTTHGTAFGKLAGDNGGASYLQWHNDKNSAFPHLHNTMNFTWTKWLFIQPQHCFEYTAHNIFCKIIWVKKYIPIL